MKLKKLVSAVACVVMAGVFATSAFAATTDQVAAAQGYLSANGISYEISPEEVDTIIANFKTEDAAKAAGDALIAKVKADPNNAETIVTNALAGYGVTVSGVAVTVNADGTISGTATINGKAASATVAGAATSEHPEIGANKDENGNWHVDEATTDAAASVTTTAGSVIKATGDNSAVVLVAGVLAVATVLGLAVRKNSNIG